MLEQQKRFSYLQSHVGTRLYRTIFMAMCLCVGAKVNSHMLIERIEQTDSRQQDLILNTLNPFIFICLFHYYIAYSDKWWDNNLLTRFVVAENQQNDI